MLRKKANHLPNQCGWRWPAGRACWCWRRSPGEPDYEWLITTPSADEQYRLAWRVRLGAALERLAALAKREDLAHHSLRGDLASFAAGICQYLSTPLASAPTLTRHHSQAEHSNDQPGERALWGVWKQVRVISQLDTDRREKGRPGHRWCLSRPRSSRTGAPGRGSFGVQQHRRTGEEPKGVHPEQGGQATPVPSRQPVLLGDSSGIRQHPGAVAAA